MIGTTKPIFMRQVTHLKTGIFGGTFDPIHMGHLIIAEEAREQLALDEVLFIPTGRPWLKAGRSITDAHHRMAMVELAIESNPHFRASDIEIKRLGLTYTVDTLVELREQQGQDTELFLILGMDALKEIGRWHNPERLFEMATLVGMSRPGYTEFDARKLDDVYEGASSLVRVLNGPLVEISGTGLRKRMSEGRSIRYRVPEGVEKYILENGLYREGE
jgi:nicotinate-nucleotide adenylyltransferase